MGYEKYTEPLTMANRTSAPRLYFNKAGQLLANAALGKLLGLDMDGGGFDVYIDRQRQLAAIDVGKNFTYKPQLLGSAKARVYGLRGLAQAVNRAVEGKVTSAEITFETENLVAPLLLQFSYAGLVRKAGGK